MLGSIAIVIAVLSIGIFSAHVLEALGQVLRPQIGWRGVAGTTAAARKVA